MASSFQNCWKYGIYSWWWEWVGDSCSVMSDSSDPMDYSSPGCPVHGILQVRILDWVAVSFSSGSSRPRDQTRISCISCTGRPILYHWATWKALLGLLAFSAATRKAAFPFTFPASVIVPCCWILPAVEHLLIEKDSFQIHRLISIIG